MSRVVRSRKAEREIVEIGIWIGKESPAASRRFVVAAERAFALLADMPELGGVCELENPALADLRVWSIKGFPKYLILYRPLPDGIEVVRVVYGARDLERLFDL